jgi:hypothetical protein
LSAAAFSKVGPGHVVEVLLLQQHAGASVVDVEKALQVGEGVGRAQGLHAGVGQRHAVALGQREDHLRLQRALDVDVQLGLGHGAQQFGQAVRGDGMDFEHDGLLENSRHPIGIRQKGIQASTSNCIRSARISIDPPLDCCECNID